MNRLRPVEGIASALRQEYPELEAIARAAGAADMPVYAVGGAVRDLLLGRERSDLDLVVEGDPGRLAEDLGGRIAEHPRFQTAVVELGGLRIDIARSRAESYPCPGALPEVRPAPLAEDLGRRDFTVNAMAVPVGGGDAHAAEGREATKAGDRPDLIDPFGGRADLEAGILRVLHPDSFRDDPTRVLRGARYAAAYSLWPDPETAALIAAADLTTVSADRRWADLWRIARDPSRLEALDLLGEWGAIGINEDGIDLARDALALLERPPWAGEADPAEVVLAAAFGPPGAAVSDTGAGPAGSRRDAGSTGLGQDTGMAGSGSGGPLELAREQPESPSEAVSLATGHGPAELVLARAGGAEWLDSYIGTWRHIQLEIDGSDLLEAGVEQGPAIGRGLRAALRRKLDGEIEGRERELAAAIAAAGGGHDALD